MLSRGDENIVYYNIKKRVMKRKVSFSGKKGARERMSRYNFKTIFINSIRSARTKDHLKTGKHP